MTKYVLIGNGVASVSAAESIRKYDDEGEIRIISKEPHLAYSRPLISYLLEGEVERGDMLYRGEKFYERNDIDVLLGSTAETIKTSKNLVILEDGEDVSFDKLLIATGGTPILPPVEGNDLNGVFTFTNWSDVRKIRDYIEENDVEKGIIVGGGLIGLKTTEALMELDLKIKVVELADKIMSATFDKKASDLAIKRLREEGCEIITENTVDEIHGEEKVETAVLQDGEELDCDMLVFAIGVTPNTEVVEDTEVETNRGILVNEHMQTNKSNIYAAGDVVEIPDIVAGDTKPIAIWPNARRQGRIAGSNMADELKEYEGSFAMNSIELCELPTISAGLTDPEEDCEIIDFYDEKNMVYKKVVIDEDKLVGIILMGDIDRAGIYTGLIKKRIDISDFKENLLDEDFGLINLPKNYREELLSGRGIEI